MYKDSLGDLKEAEEAIQHNGPRSEVLLQAVRTMQEAVGKVLTHVGPSLADVGCDVNWKRGVVSEERVIRGKYRPAVSKRVAGADVQEKLKAVSTDGLVYGHDLEVMDPSLWRNLPPQLLELVFERVVSRVDDSTQCRSIRLQDSLPPRKVSRLIYANSGRALFALGSNAVMKVWKWRGSVQNPSGKASASFPPSLFRPESGLLMVNHAGDGDLEEAVPSMALSRNDSYVISASGGRVTLYNTMTFWVMTTCMPPPPAVTFLLFYPQDNNIIAMGLKDSTIKIYNLRTDIVLARLEGHQDRITGLAFSKTLAVLVSSGADAQLCLWSTETWEKCDTKFVQGGISQATGGTDVQSHNSQDRFLVVHESQLAVYVTADSKLDSLQQWSPQSPVWAPLSTATYSCDNQLVFAGFVDGSVAVFDAESLQPRCRLAPPVHTPPSVGGPTVYPLTIVAHPTEPNQFALGLSDGGVQVIEPLESEDEWGILTVLPPL